MGDNYVLDVTLPIESTDLDEVVVTGTRSSILNSDRAGVATNINNRQLNVLPTVSRSISDFTRLTPQAGNSGSFGGRDTRYNNVSIDGAAFAQRLRPEYVEQLPGRRRATDFTGCYPGNFSQPDPVRHSPVEFHRCEHQRRHQIGR